MDPEAPPDAAVRSPYPGPRPFEDGDQDLFFGRDLEADELVSRVVAHRVLVLYAPSGAGKTSLLNAGLIPRLKEEESFEVLPLARVWGRIPANLQLERVPNVYAFNTLLSWSEDGTPPQDLIGESLAELLGRRPRGEDFEGLPKPRFAVFDQFEELFSAYPERWYDRRAFFAELAHALTTDPLLRVLLVLREDYLAQLDPYASLLPENLRNRMRLERLREAAALLAVEEPLRGTGISFKADVAKELVSELSKGPVETITGGTVVVKGELIEPVQLQVTCESLWRNLPAGVTEISRDNLEAFGDVDQALSGFYERIIAEAATASGSGVTEARLRLWFEDTLITPASTRGTVFQGRKETGGIPNAVIDKLERRHLIRGELRGGSRWYELSHERFIEPIRQSNVRWRGDQQEAFETWRRLKTRARKWSDQDRGREYLLDEAELLEADRWLAGPDHADFGDVDLVLGLVRASRDEVEHERIALRRLNRTVSLVLVLVTILGGLAAWQWRQARQKALEAEAGKRIISALKDLDSDPEQSLRSALEAADMAVDAPAIRQELEAVLRQGLYAHRWGAIWAREEGPIAAFAWSADGRRLVTAERAEAVRVWEAQSGEELLSLSEIPEQIAVLAVNRDGTHLALFDWAGGAQIWDTASSTPVPLVGPPEVVYAAAFSPDGRYLATAHDAAPKLWDVATGKPVATLWSATGPSYSVVFRPDGAQLATAGDDGTIRLWDTTSLDEGLVTEFDTFPGLGVPINAVAFSPDGRRLASASDDRAVHLWLEGSLEETFLHAGEVMDVGFSRDGNYFVTVTLEGVVRAWYLYHPYEILRFELRREPRDEVPDIDYSLAARGGRLARATDDGFETTELIFEDVATLTGHESSVRAVSFDPEGRRLATAGADRTVRIWDGISAELLKTLKGHQGPVNAVAFSSDGTLLASASDDRTAHVWDLSSGELLRTLSDHEGYVTSVIFDADGHVVTAGFDETVRVWDAASGTPVRQWSSPSRVHSVAMSPDGTILATGHADGTAILWDHGTGQRKATLAGHMNLVNAVAFSPLDDRLATAGADQKVKIWNHELGEPLLTLTGHEGRVNALAFSPDGQSLATAGLDGALLLWDTDSGAQRSKMIHRRLPLRAVAFSPDGGRLASAGDDGMVRLEPLRLETLVQLARARSDAEPPDRR